jgi:SAM-dependent methyltransferase
VGAHDPALTGVRAFYDGLAPLYHLVYADWDASIARQGAALAATIEARWGATARVVLDAAVGIGTQALGLLAHGFAVTGSDLSPAAVRRAVDEAAARGVRLPCHVADFRALAARSARADVVLVCDNALPHLPTEAEIARALRECFRCARPGGGCLISMRDYGAPSPPGTVEVHPYGERTWRGRRYHVRQLWTWKPGGAYDVALEVTPLGGVAEPPTVLHATYVAIALARVAALMREAGFADVARLDGRFFQPLLAGTRPR